MAISKKVDYEEFVRLWAENKTDAEIAEHLEINKGSVSYHAKRLKDAGVRLPRRLRPAEKIDSSSLNNLLDRLVK